jgi:hypothetical protein
MFRLVASATLVSVAYGDDYFFATDNNWNNPANWDDGNGEPATAIPPAGAKIAFNTGSDANRGIPGCLAAFGERGGSIKVGEDRGSISVSSMTLPESGKLILANDLTISFTDETAEAPTVQWRCKAPQERDMRCAANWRVGSPTGAAATSPPCSDDNVVFDDNSAYAVDVPPFATFGEVRVDMNGDGAADERDLTFRGNENDGSQFSDWLATRPGQFSSQEIDVLDTTGANPRYANVNCASQALCERTCQNSCPVVGSQDAVEATAAAVEQTTGALETATEAIGALTSNDYPEDPTPVADRKPDSSTELDTLASGAASGFWDGANPQDQNSFAGSMTSAISDGVIPGVPALSEDPGQPCQQADSAECGAARAAQFAALTPAQKEQVFMFGVEKFFTDFESANKAAVNNEYFSRRQAWTQGGSEGAAPQANAPANPNFMVKAEFNEDKNSFMLTPDAEKQAAEGLPVQLSPLKAANTISQYEYMTDKLLEKTESGESVASTWVNDALNRPVVTNVAFDFTDYSKAMRKPRSKPTGNNLDQKCAIFDGPGCYSAVWRPGRGTPQDCQCRDPEHEFAAYTSIETSLTKEGAMQSLEWWREKADTVGAELRATGTFEETAAATNARREGGSANPGSMESTPDGTIETIIMENANDILPYRIQSIAGLDYRLARSTDVNDVANAAPNAPIMFTIRRITLETPQDDSKDASAVVDMDILNQALATAMVLPYAGTRYVWYKAQSDAAVQAAASSTSEFPVIIVAAAAGGFVALVLIALVVSRRGYNRTGNGGFTF